jgi:hypothetical protein
MWLLFVPILVLALLAFVTFSLFAGVFWAVGSAWPLLLIGLGAWMFWHEDGRHNRRRHAHLGWAVDGRRPAQRSSASTVPVRPADTRKSSPRKEEPKVAREPELPIDVQVKVEQLRRKIDILLGYADRFPPFSQDLFLVQQTASDYLPRTINAYLSLSKDTVDKPLGADGKTARQELKAQLDLLDKKLDDIAQDLQRQDADRLLANRRFLEARFGTREGAKEAQLSA